MLPIAGHKTWLRQWVGIEHQILSLFAAGAILHGNYSFLALCNPSGRTTGLAGGTEAAAAVAVGPVRAAPLGWPSRSPGSALNQDSSQPSTIQSMRWAQAALARVGGRGCRLSSRGHCWGQQQLYWVTYFTLCVHQGLRNPWIQAYALTSDLRLFVTLSTLALFPKKTQQS